MLGPFHEAPHLGCTCGLHGTHELDLLRRTRCPAVLGRVALWGRVIEHELGFRARYGYPQRLAADLPVLLLAMGHARRRTRDDRVVLERERAAADVRRTRGDGRSVRDASARVAAVRRDRSAPPRHVRGRPARALAALRPGGRHRGRRRDATSTRVGAPHQPAPQLAAVRRDFVGGVLRGCDVGRLDLGRCGVAAIGIAAAVGVAVRVAVAVAARCASTAVAFEARERERRGFASSRRRSALALGPPRPRCAPPTPRSRRDPRRPSTRLRIGARPSATASWSRSCSRSSSSWRFRAS